MRYKPGFPAVLLVTLGALGGFGPVAAQTVNDEGLEQVESRFQVTFRRPGAAFDRYTRLAMLDTFVEFRDEWLIDQNRTRSTSTALGPDSETTTATRIAEDFAAAFADTLGDEGYETIGPAAGIDVLLLRPALLRVDVSADLYAVTDFNSQLSGLQVSFTLYLELYDSVSGTLLARMIDQKADSVRDRADVRRIFRQWARNLAAALERGFD